jgi:hypothetical protein
MPSAASLALADWLLVLTTLDADWSDTDVLRLYRARWQIELVYKRMKQVLRLNQIRCQTAALAEATVRALLVAWALHQTEADQVRALLPTGAETLTQSTRSVVSSWLLTALCLDTLRQQVQGHWSASHLQVCLTRLHRYLVNSPRRRIHWETDTRAWLLGRLASGAVPRAQAA